METIEKNVEKFRDEVTNWGGCEAFEKALTAVWMDYATMLLNDPTTWPPGVEDNLFYLRTMIKILSPEKEQIKMAG